MKKQFATLTFLTLLALSSCQSSQSENALTKNPDLLFKIIEDNPEKFMQAVEVAAKKNRALAKEKQEQLEAKEIEAALANPYQPNLSKDEASLGPSNAPITLVEYSDFECSFCSRSSQTVKHLLQKYPGKVRFVYKHLPLRFHTHALISAKYFEAIKRQSLPLAFKFHDKIFANQGKLKSGGENYLKKIAKNLKINMKKLTADINLKEVSQKIQNDMQEAAKFNMQGTPGFLLNGVPVRGAYPPEHFVAIIDKLVEKGKLTL